MKAKEILERVEDRLRRLANDCAMASMPLEACLSTERTANMVNDSLDEVREALAALEAEGVGLREQMQAAEKAAMQRAKADILEEVLACWRQHDGSATAPYWLTFEGLLEGRIAVLRAEEQSDG